MAVLDVNRQRRLYQWLVESDGKADVRRPFGATKVLTVQIVLVAAMAGSDVESALTGYGNPLSSPHGVAPKSLRKPQSCEMQATMMDQSGIYRKPKQDIY